MRKVLLLQFFVSVLGPVLAARKLGAVENIARQGDVAVIEGRLSGKGVKVRMYGDSLSADGFADRREWLLWRGDSAFYAGEETFFAISAPVVKVPAVVWPLVPEQEYSTDFVLFVRENKEALRSCPASFSAKVLPMVSLVLPEGDTLRSVVPLECALRVEADSAAVWERCSVRWYAGGEASSMDYYYPYDSIGAFRNNYDRVGSAIETGYHSEAEFELEGNRISWGTLWSVANTFEGATGILQDDAEVYHEYDPQGRLTASNTDQIAEIEYNHLSQPVRVKFFDGKEQCSVYDNAGQLIKRYTRPGGGRADRIDQVFIGPYEFGANRSLKKIHFAGGYFSADGKVHYHITDYQGSVGAVIRGDGVVEQRTHYYPYGEPWLEPEGDNRRLHTGKERLRWGSTPVHDFGARILPPAIPFWTTPDPKATSFYGYSPYCFCLSDPINYVDKDGEMPTDYEAALMAQHVYNYNLDDTLPTELIEAGWTLSDFDTSIQMKGYDKGFKSALYERTVDGVTEYAYAYAGTELGIDWAEDFAQIFGLSPQYYRAIENAKTLSSELSNNELTFVGHSLGGGEAAAASMATGRMAMTFNPAAVSPITRILYGLYNPIKILNYTVVPPKGKVGGCGVTILQDGLGMPAPGWRIPIQLPISNPIKAHSIDSIVDYYKERK